MVVRTNSREIIDNHNGFFTPQFVDFLIRYVTDIEEERFLERQQRRRGYRARAR